MSFRHPTITTNNKQLTVINHRENAKNFGRTIGIYVETHQRRSNNNWNRLERERERERET